MPTQEFTSDGTWTVPARVSTINVLCIGGGAGGSQNWGGGGGAYSQETTISVTPGNNHNYTVGSGGSPSVNGGDTIFYHQNGSTQLVMAKGGTIPTGGAAGSGVGSIKTSGGSGGLGNFATGGGGGGAGGPSFDGGNGTDASGGGAGGGSSGTYGGQGGNGSDGAIQGDPGQFYGGGAGGGAEITFGGDGRVGIVVITYELDPLPPTRKGGTMRGTHYWTNPFINT